MKSAVCSASQPEGASGRVGWGRITVFAIPVMPIHINGKGNAEIMTQIKSALDQVGYKTQIQPGITNSQKTLICQVERFSYNNYTCLFPLVPTWGRLELNVGLADDKQKIVWTRHFRGSGSSLNFLNGYTSAVRKSNTQILNQMIKAFSSEEFHNALVK